MSIFSYHSVSRFLKTAVCLSIAFVSTFPAWAQSEAARLKQRVNQGWKFHLGNPEAKFYELQYKDSSWETVHLPHTLKLTTLTLDDVKDDKTQPTFQRDVGWYRKTIKVPQSQRLVYLEFEGAHQVTNLWVNGKPVGVHDLGGYTPFHFDITRFVKKGADNQITLLVDNRRRDDVAPDPGPMDYIKFSGLYRDVYLVEKQEVHIPFNWEMEDTGVRITTPSVDPINLNATINIKVGVRNEATTTKLVTVKNLIVDTTGLVVFKTTSRKELKAGAHQLFNQIGGIEDDLHLWSPDQPYLYRVISQVFVDNKRVDQVENPLGIRKFELNPREGFLLNGQPIELIGANRHQHYPYIGDAVPNSLHEKDVLQFKSLGFNVLRTAHYPQDDALLEACDRLGILVYEEAPTWISIGDKAWFDKLEQVARRMVRNHRNHPSVVIWGGGINHRGYVPQLHYAVKQEDPTRFTASQSSKWTGWQTSGLTDIFGNMTYGEFSWGRKEPMLAMEGHRGPQAVGEYLADPIMTGLIAWNGHDYYTFHPSNDDDRVRNSGFMDLFRTIKQETYWFPTEFRDEPSLYLKDDWQTTTEALTVYTNAQKVEAFINGKSRGVFYPDTLKAYQGLSHPPLTIPVDGSKGGTLRLVGWRDGAIWVDKSFYPPGTAASLLIEADTSGRLFTADGSDILMVYAQVLDAHGQRLSTYSSPVKFEVTGDAQIVGEDIGTNPIGLWSGKAPILVRAGTEPGRVTVQAKVNGMMSNVLELYTVAPKTDKLDGTLPIRDLARIRVDIGGEGQLPQFDWVSWVANDEGASEKQFDTFGGFKAKIAPASAHGILRSLGEMNVKGKYGYAFGEGVAAIDDQGLELELTGLPKGQYKFISFHHAPQSNTNDMDPNREKLKSLKLPSWAYAQSLEVHYKDSHHIAQVQKVRVTDGGTIEGPWPGMSKIMIYSDGHSPISIRFVAPDKKAIWFNAFEIQAWD